MKTVETVADVEIKKNILQLRPDIHEYASIPRKHYVPSVINNFVTSADTLPFEDNLL